MLRTALHVFEAEHHVDPVSGRAGRADSLQAASPMPQRRTARATGAAPSAREGTAVATAHAPPAADTADAAGLSESLAHSRQMDSWEAHLAASDVTLRWIEGLMHPAAFPTLPMLVLELRAASAQSMAGGRARRRGLFLPVAVTKAPEPQIVRNQVCIHCPWTRSGLLAKALRHSQQCECPHNYASGSRPDGAAVCSASQHSTCESCPVDLQLICWTVSHAACSMLYCRSTSAM